MVCLSIEYIIYISIYISGFYIWYWAKICGVANAVGFMIFKIYEELSGSGVGCMVRYTSIGCEVVFCSHLGNECMEN